MSLSSVLFESASVLGMSDEDMARYNYDDGHRAIFTETAMELRDVFEATFYMPEQVELAAMRDGTTVAESYEYQELMENFITDGIEKILRALENLWKKIVVFFSNIKAKFITASKDNDKFVEKFNKAANGRLDLSGFKYKTWTFTNIDDFESLMDGARVKAIDNINNEVNAKLGLDSPDIEDTNNLSDALARVTATFLKDMTGTDDEEDANEAMWSHFHNGARKRDEKPEISISSVDSYLSAIKSSKSIKDMDKFKATTDKEFKKIKSQIKDEQNKAASSSDNSGRLTILRSEMNAVNKISSKANQFITIWRKASEERVSTYRNICTAALAYSNRKK